MNHNWDDKSAVLMSDIDRHVHKLCNETNYIHRLGDENDWNFTYTVRVIEEYKKFLFLFAVSNEPVSPPHPIDEAWHNHILYTKDYFVGLSKVMGKTLHHEPETGRKEKQEVEQLKNWYDSTIERYNKFFGPEPKDIWTVKKKENYSIPEQEPAMDMSGVLQVNVTPLIILIAITSGFALTGLFTFAIVGLVGTILYYWISKSREDQRKREKEARDKWSTYYESMNKIKKDVDQKTSYSSKSSSTKKSSSKSSSTKKTESETKVTSTTETQYHDNGIDPVTTYLLLDSVKDHPSVDPTPSTDHSSKSSCASCKSCSSHSSSSSSHSCSSSSSSSHSSCSSSSSCSSGSSCGSSCGGGGD